MKITLNYDQICQYATQRDQGMTDIEREREANLARLMIDAKKRKYMLKSDLISVAEWKWRGTATQELCEKNTPLEVKEVSQLSFSTISDKIRIKVLLTLHGVNWAMSSVILHFVFTEKYPIFDKRAMKAVNCSKYCSFKNGKDIQICALKNLLNVT